MAETGIKRREDLQKAIGILEKCNTVSAEVMHGKQRGFRKISLRQPGTGIIYPDVKVIGEQAYRDGYDLIAALDQNESPKQLPITDPQDIPEELLQRVYAKFVPSITFQDSGEWWMT